MKDGYKIIDSHCHIYPDKIAVKATQSTAGFYSMSAQYDGTLNRLMSLEEEAGVDLVIVQSVATSPAQVTSINRYIADTVSASRGKLLGLGTLHPDSADIEGDIKLIKELGLRGVKLHADIQKIAINDPRCYKIYEILEGDLPILMHTGDNRYNFSNPDNLAPVLDTFKNLTVIGAHFGGWSVWDEAIRRLYGYENFYVDTSSVFGFMGSEFVSGLLQKCDINRVLFGTDYPMWTPLDEISMLLSFNLPASRYRKIFAENCARVYGLH